MIKSLQFVLPKHNKTILTIASFCHRASPEAKMYRAFSTRWFVNGILHFAFCILSFAFCVLPFAIQAQSDISVRVTSNSPTYAVYNNVTFFVVVKNNGPNAANNVVCTAQQPTGSSNGCNITTVGFWRNWDTGVWAIGNLNAGDSVTLQATVFALSTTAITMSAAVTSGSMDPVLTNNNASTTVTVGNAAPNLGCGGTITNNTDSVNLAVALTANQSELNFGLTESFILTIKNTSSLNATNVKVQLSVPTGLSIQLANVAGLGSFDVATGIWNIGTVVGNSSHIITVNTLVGQGGAFKCYAQVTACDQPDVNSKPNNYSGVAKEDDEADFNVLGLYADLSMKATFKPGTPAQIRLGDTVTFIATLTNYGPTRADGVKIRSYLPNGMQFVSASPTIGIYDSQLGVWILSDVPDPNNLGNKPGFTIQANTTQTLTISFKAIQLGAITYDTEVRSDNVPDPNSTPSNNVLTENDESQVIFTVVNFTDPNGANLSLSANTTTVPVNANDPITVKFGIFNAGPATATNIVVKLNGLPTGVNINSVTPTSGNYASNNWTIPSLAANGTAFLTLSGSVGCIGAVSIFGQVQSASQTDYASVHGNNTDGVPHEADEAAVTINAVSCTGPSADIVLTNSILLTPLVNNDSIAFQIIVKNNGPNTANVVVKDSTPVSLGITNFTPSVGTTYANNFWTVNNLASGASATLFHGGRATIPKTVSDFAQVWTSSQPDPNSTPGNNTTGIPSENDETIVSFNPTGSLSADLKLTMVSDKVAVANGATVAFTLTLTNVGPSATNSVTVKDILPNGLTYSSFSSTLGAYSNASGIWNVGALTSGQVVTLTINTSVASIASTLVNFAQVQTSSVSDPNSTPGNNTTNIPSENDEAAVTISSQSATQCDVILSLSAPAQYAAALPVYQNVTFTCTLTNRGPAAAQNVTVKYAVPSGVGYNSNIPSKGSYEPYLGIWTVGTVAANETVTLQLTLFTLSATTSQFAQVLANTTPDIGSTPGNNTDNIVHEKDEAALKIPSGPVVKLTALKLSMSSSATLIKVADPLTFTLSLSNSGDTTASGVIVKDILPAGFTFISSTTAQGSYSNTTSNWTVGNISVGSTATLTITGTVGANFTNALTNYAQVTASSPADKNSVANNNPGPSPVENDEAAITVLSSSNTSNLTDLLLTMTSAPTYAIYQTHNFTLTLTNRKGATATGIKVDFPFPKYFNYGGNVTSTAGTVYDSYFHNWAVPSLAAGQTVTMTLTLFNINNSAPITAFAQVIASSPADIGSTPNNNSTGIPVEKDEAGITITAAFAAPAPTALGTQAQIEKQYVPIIITNVSPNPINFEGDLTIQVNSLWEGKTDFHFSDLNGKILLTDTRVVEKGINKLNFDVSNFPQGLFIVRTHAHNQWSVPAKICKL